MILARWLATEPRLLILDEPTRGIDVGAKAEIQRLVLALADDGKSSVFISSELDEVLRTSHRIVVLRDRVKVPSSSGEVDERPIMQAIAGGRRDGRRAASLLAAASATAGSSSRSSPWRLILLFDLVFVPASSTLETIDGHLYGNLVDILRNGADDHAPGAGHDPGHRHRRRGPLGRRGDGDLGGGRGACLIDPRSCSSLGATTRTSTPDPALPAVVVDRARASATAVRRLERRPRRLRAASSRWWRR